MRTRKRINVFLTEWVAILRRPNSSTGNTYYPTQRIGLHCRNSESSIKTLLLRLGSQYVDPSGSESSSLADVSGVPLPSVCARKTNEDSIRREVPPVSERQLARSSRSECVNPRSGFTAPIGETTSLASSSSCEAEALLVESNASQHCGVGQLGRVSPSYGAEFTGTIELMRFDEFNRSSSDCTRATSSCRPTPMKYCFSFSRDRFNSPCCPNS